MNFLLKIVQGPNAGAEVALVEGVAVSVGRADSCDIVLADASLPDVAFRLEPGADGVVLQADGAAPEALEPFAVKTFGSTSFAIGPADAPWGALKWPEARPAPQDAPPPPAPAPAEEPAPAPAERKSRRGCGLGCLLLALLLLAAAAVLLWLFRDRVAEFRGRLAASRGNAPAGDVGDQAASLRPLDWLVAEFPGLVVAEKNGRTVVSGNFETRAQRLAAAAELYQRNPGVALELTDDQSMRTAAEDTLNLLSLATLRVAEATNRVVALSGTASSATELRHAIEALNDDIRHLANVDVSQVELLAPSVDIGAAAPAETPAQARRRTAPAAPALPVCGIVTTPYPCLVLRDGRRVFEGANWGENYILKIEADSVTVTNAAGRFTWKP